MQSTLPGKANQGSQAKSPDIAEIDPLLREHTRFVIAGHLYPLGKADSLHLFRQTKLTWGNLSWHLAKLKTAGYVSIEKGFLENKPHTAVRLTDQGRIAFEQHRKAMQHMPGRPASSGMQNTAGPKPASGPSEVLPAYSEKENSDAVLSRVKSDIFRRSLVFSDLTDEELPELCRIAAYSRIKAGDYMFHAGDKADRFWVIAAGRFKVLTHSTSGKDFINSLAGAGVALGLSPLVSGKPHPSSAQAAVDSAVLFIKNAEFMSFAARCPEAGFKIFRRMLHVIGARHLEAVDQLGDLAGERAYHRLAKVLSALSAAYGLILPFTRQEIAQMAGTTTETAVRFVGRLRREGVIRPARGKIVVLDRSKLGRLV